MAIRAAIYFGYKRSKKAAERLERDVKARCEALSTTYTLEIYQDQDGETESLARLLGDLQEHKLDHIFSDEFHETSAKAALTLECWQTAEAHGTTVDTVTTKKISDRKTINRLSKALRPLTAAANFSSNSKKIRDGLTQAKQAGIKLGAPKKNQNKLNKTKKYERRQIQQLRQLLAKGISYREIVGAVDFKITIGTVSNIKKKLDDGTIEYAD